MSTRNRRKRGRIKQAENIAAYLSSIYRKDLLQFHTELNKRMVSWLSEIHYRAQRLKRYNKSSVDPGDIFGVIKKAEMVLTSLHGVEPEVIEKALDQLRLESTKVLAPLFGPELYRLVRQYKLNILSRL